MNFELTKDFLAEIKHQIEVRNSEFIDSEIGNLHPADIADVIQNLTINEGKYLFRLLEEEKAADALVELDEEYQEKFLDSLSIEEIAEQVDQLDSDDAADILGTLTEDEKDEAISHMQDKELASEVIDLLKYDEDSAGGLMQSEYIQAKSNWTVKRCVIELRRQAEDVENIFTIYVVDEDEILLGVLSLKRLLFAKPDA